MLSPDNPEPQTLKPKPGGTCKVGLKDTTGGKFRVVRASIRLL